MHDQNEKFNIKQVVSKRDHEREQGKPHTRQSLNVNKKVLSSLLIIFHRKHHQLCHCVLTQKSTKDEAIGNDEQTKREFD